MLTCHSISDLKVHSDLFYSSKKKVCGPISRKLKTREGLLAIY